MNKNYLILAHKNPDQLHRLVKRLENKNTCIFIHIDGRSNISDFQKLRSCQNTVLIRERENCIWGDFSIVRATLHLIKNALKTGNKGFHILLSGQDYPIKSQREIEDFLERNINFNFIECMRIEEKWNKKMVKDKLENYHFIHSEKRSDSGSYAPFFATSLSQKLRSIFHVLKGKLPFVRFKETLHLPKRVPVFQNQFAGSQWWAFNHQTLLKMNDFIQLHFKVLENYYQYTSAPDEIFFQSVLMHIKESDSSIKIKPAITYANWSRKNTPLPVTFQMDDFDELQKNSALFARKFDMESDESIFGRIDNELLKNQF